MEPPSAGCAHSPLTRIRIIEDEDGMNRISTVDSGDKCRVIGDPQILSKPDDVRLRFAHVGRFRALPESAKYIGRAPAPEAELRNLL